MDSIDPAAAREGLVRQHYRPWKIVIGIESPHATMLLLSGALAKWSRHKYHTDPGLFRVAYCRFRSVMYVGLLLRSVHYWFRLCVHSAVRYCAGRVGGNHQDLRSPDATQEERARTPIAILSEEDVAALDTGIGLR